MSYANIECVDRATQIGRLVCKYVVPILCLNNANVGRVTLSFNCVFFSCIGST